MYHYYDDGNKPSKQFKFKRTIGFILTAASGIALAATKRREDESGMIVSVVAAAVGAGGVSLLTTPAPRKLERAGVLVVEKVRDINVSCCAVTKSVTPTIKKAIVRLKEGSYHSDSIPLAYYTARSFSVFDPTEAPNKNDVASSERPTFKIDLSQASVSDSTEHRYDDGVNQLKIIQKEQYINFAPGKISADVAELINKTAEEQGSFAFVMKSGETLVAHSLPKFHDDQLTFTTREFVIDETTSQNVKEFLASSDAHMFEPLEDEWSVPLPSDILGFLWERL